VKKELLIFPGVFTIEILKNKTLFLLAEASYLDLVKTVKNILDEGLKEQ